MLSIAKMGIAMVLIGFMAQTVGERISEGKPIQGISVGALSMWGLMRFVEVFL